MSCLLCFLPDYVIYVPVSPGYPLTLLPATITSTLLEYIRECSVVAQEKAFIYCVDRLLSDLLAGSSTWATRIMVLLLIKSNHSVCVEASRIVCYKGVWLDGYCVCRGCVFFLFFLIFQFFSAIVKLSFCSIENQGYLFMYVFGHTYVILYLTLAFCVCFVVYPLPYLHQTESFSLAIPYHLRKFNCLPLLIRLFLNATRCT